VPKQGRIAATIQFLGQADVPSDAQGLRMPVQELLKELEPAIPAQVDSAMSQGTKGTKETRPYRRAMILILSVLNQNPPARAKQAVSSIPDAQLKRSLGTMLKDVKRVVGPRRLNPAVHALLAGPQAFLTANRIKLGRGQLTTSTASEYELSWDSPKKLYLMEPPVPWHHYITARFQGFNIHVQQYSAVQNNLGAIQGAQVAGSIALTTQLTGCSILYSVNGGDLVAAHIQPTGQVGENLPPALAGAAGSPVGVLLASRLVASGDLANPVNGGTLGIFGMVNTPAETGLRHLGNRNIRVHGYTDTLGSAYFLGVKRNGHWELYGQQNDANSANGGVSKIQKLYP
jgi:hypothetical protein